MLLQKQLAAAEQQATAQSSIPVQPASSSQGGQLAPPSPAAAPTPSDMSHSSTPSLALASPNPALSPNASAQSGASTLTPSQRKALIRHQLMQRRLQKMGGSLSVDLMLPGEREAGQASAQSSRSESNHARLTDSHSLGALPPGIGSGIVQDGSDERDELCSPNRMDVGDANGALVCALCCTPVSHRPPPPAPPLCANCSINAVNHFGLQLTNPAAMFPFLPLLSLPQVAGAPKAGLGLGFGDGASGLPPTTLSLPTTGVCRPSRFLDTAAAFNPAMFIPSPIAEERIQTTDFQTGTLLLNSLLVQVHAMSFFFVVLYVHST